MAGDLLSTIPEHRRDAVGAALSDALGSGGATAVVPVPGGASGALAYRVESALGPHLLRIEGERLPMRNPHQTACLLAAAEAGIAPPVRHADDAAGVLLVGWIDQRPLAEHPGGPEVLAREAGELIRRLHELDRFPSTGDHLQKLRGLVGIVAASGRVGPGLLEPHRAALDELVGAYPWEPAAHVSCHNDPNQGNLLSDGERLWLVDWETAGANDPMVDLASLCAHLAPSPHLRDELLAAALGRTPDDDDRARLTIASQLGRAFAGLLLLLITVDPVQPVQDDLAAMDLERFTALVTAGELVPGQPATTIAFAKICLEALVRGMDDPEVVGALARLRR